MLLECIESDEREAGLVENSRRLLISERVVAVRRIRDAWLVAKSRGGSSSNVIQKGQESAGQRTTDGRMLLVQLVQRLEWLMCAFNKMKEQRSIEDIPDMLARWRRSLHLASAVGTKMVTAVRTS